MDRFAANRAPGGKPFDPDMFVRHPRKAEVGGRTAFMATNLGVGQMTEDASLPAVAIYLGTNGPSLFALMTPDGAREIAACLLRQADAAEDAAAAHVSARLDAVFRQGDR